MKDSSFHREKENLNLQLHTADISSLVGVSMMEPSKQEKALRKSKEKNQLLKAKVKEQKEAIYQLETKSSHLSRQLQDAHYRLAEAEDVAHG